MTRRSVEQLVEELQSQIISCDNCEPWDSEDGPVFVHGRRRELYDLVLFTVEVPEDLYDEVVSQVTCPNCGRPIGGCEDVGTRFEFEIEFENALRRADRRYGRRLASFADFLQRYPMLGAAHPVGRRIIKELSTWPRTALEEAVWFRARRVEGGRKFTPDDLRLPPEDSVSSAGRFNHAGQSHWYLAGDAETAIAEVVDKGETMAWLQRWKVGRIDPVLDLVTFGPGDPLPVSDADIKELPLLSVAMIFGDHLKLAVDRGRAWKPQYFVPLFVMDAAKQAGFRGIRYESTRSRSDLSLVIFDADSPVQAEGEPTIAELGDEGKFGLVGPGVLR